MSDSIAITSGKGGVGKTTFAVNLSIAQRKFTDQVFLLDTDMGMANSHVLLGVNPEYSISDVISGEKQIYSCHHEIRIERVRNAWSGLRIN